MIDIKNRRNIIIAIIVLSYLPVLLFADLPTTQALTSLQLAAYVTGRLIGMIGTILIFWQYMLGFRGIVSKVLVDLVWVNRLHQKLGKYGFVFILFHPILILISFKDDWLRVLTLQMGQPFSTFVLLGELAFAILTFVWVTSALLRSKLPYRLWKYLHLSVYLILPLVLIHGANIGTALNSVPPLTAYWRLMMLIALLAGLYRLAHKLGFTRYKYEVASINKVTHDVNRYTFKPINKFIVPKPGQFVYVQTSTWGEEHPFTASLFDPGTKEISLSIKTFGWFTQSLQKLKVGDKVILDGPYGVFTSEAYATSKDIVIIAGGIGITPFLELFKRLKNLRNKKVWLFYGAKTVADVAYKEMLDKLPGKFPNFKHVYVISNEPGYSGEKGYLSAELLKKYLGDDLTKYEYFVTGPPLMMKSAEDILQKQMVSKSFVHMEKFSL